MIHYMPETPESMIDRKNVNLGAKMIINNHLCFIFDEDDDTVFVKFPAIKDDNEMLIERSTAQIYAEMYASQIN